jgi:aminopeptidase N
LREGLPTYSSLLFLENAYGNQMMRLELERSRRVALAVASDEALELGFEMETAEAIYALNYHKAAVVLHMLREVMGLDGFSRLLRRLHNLGTDVTTDVFIQQAEEEHGDDLSWFFDAWIRSGDVPSFHVRYAVRPAADNSSRYELTGTIEQEGAAIRYPLIVRIPLEAAPPLESTVWVEPGTTDFNIVLPSPPRDFQFDPHGDLLYREVTIERTSPPAQ